MWLFDRSVVARPHRPVDVNDRGHPRAARAAASRARAAQRSTSSVATDSMIVVRGLRAPRESSKPGRPVSELVGTDPAELVEVSAGESIGVLARCAELAGLERLA